MSYYKFMDITQIPKQNSQNSKSENGFSRNYYENQGSSLKPQLHSKPKKSIKKYLKIFSLVLTCLVLVWGGYFGWKTYSVSRKIQIDNDQSGNGLASLISNFIPSNHKPLSGEADGRINILLLGIAGKNKPGQNLTDTIMVMSINTQNKKVALLSIPRDFYANIPQTSFSTKINTIYQYGLNQNKGSDLIKKTVENILDVPIHYTVILNFDGFKKIIDDLGGINVYVERDIYDAHYPGPNYSYETFEIQKGSHLMNGETALKYVRERHDDPDGDFGRAKRQQQVIQAVKNKVFSAKTLLNPLSLNSLLDNLGDNIKTNIGLDDLESFIYWSKQADTQNIENAVVDAWNPDSLLKVSHVMAGDVRAFILVPRVGMKNYSEIRDLAQNIFNLEELKRRQTEIEKESASIALINESNDNNLTGKIKNLLQDKLNFKNVAVVYNKNKIVRENTVIYDKTNGAKIFTLDEIIKKIGAELGKNNNDIIDMQAKDDFVLLIGNDLEKSYGFAEDSLEDFKNAQDNQDQINFLENK
jgi:polyisoprenyl-teichoic acid--peptidoglycan teichoic acid transferase